MKAPAKRAAAALALGSVLCIGAEAAFGEPKWYVAAGAGGNWMSGAHPRGWNRDTLCYPDFDCYGQIPAPSVEGYRWGYRLDHEAGYAFELAIGRAFGRLRLEGAYAQRRNRVAYGEFTGVTYFDGTPVGPLAGTTVSAAVESDIGSLRVRTLSLNAYWDFPGALGRMTPYVGAGAGMARSAITNVRFKSVYRDLANPPGVHHPSLSFYDGLQDETLRDVAAIGHLYAGVSLPWGERSRVGLKLAFSRLDSLQDEGSYRYHAMHSVAPDFANHARFEASTHWSALLTWQWALGD